MRGTPLLASWFFLGFVSFGENGWEGGKRDLRVVVVRACTCLLGYWMSRACLGYPEMSGDNVCDINGVVDDG